MRSSVRQAVRVPCNFACQPLPVTSAPMAEKHKGLRRPCVGPKKELRPWP